MKKWAIGIDIGGTKTAVAHIQENGTVLKKMIIPTNVTAGPNGIKNDVVHAIKDLKKDSKDLPVGIGVGIAGQVSSETGIVHFAPNLNWHHVPLKTDLEQIFNLPIAVINDVRAVTFGEWKFGAGKNCDDLVVIFVGTGIGGGIVSNGTLVKGTNNAAAELGHLTIDYRGERCTCGNQGCLEAIAGGWAIAKRAQEIVKSHPIEGKKILELAKGEIISARTVINAADAGDLLAKKLLQEVAEALIAGTVSIVSALNPRRVIFGGGVISGAPWLVDVIGEGVKKKALKALSENLEIVPSQLGADAGVIGAGAFLF